jgi:ABC-type amino acid transport substrate-binding protein
MLKNKFILYLCLLLGLTVAVVANAQTSRYNLAEKHWLDRHQKLLVGVVEQTPPLLFYAGGSNPQGLVADYLRALALHLGLQLEIIRYPDRGGLLQALEDGEVDVLGAWPMGFDDTGAVLSSRPFLSLPVSLYSAAELPNTGLKGLRGRTLAVLQGSVWEQLALIVPGVASKSYASLDQALVAVSEGQVLAYLGDAASVNYLLKRESFDELEEVREPDLSYDLALATRTAQPELLSLLQKGLDRIGTDELQEIWHRWPGVERPQEYSSHVPYFLLWVALILIWSALLAWWVHRYVGQREQQRRFKLKQSIRRLQRRDERHKRDLRSLKQRTKKYRRAMQQNRHRLRLMDEVMPSGAWVWVPEEKACQWDEKMFTLFQQDPDGFEPTPEAILELVHEDDRARVAALFSRPQGESESQIRYRVLLPDGRLRWLLDFSYFNADESGGGEQRTGLCWDVSNYLGTMEAEELQGSVES